MTVLSRVASFTGTLAIAGAVIIGSPGVATETAGAEIVARAIGTSADASLTTDLATDADIVAPIVSSTTTAAPAGSTAIDSVSATRVAFASLGAAIAAQPGAGSVDGELACLAGATYFEAKGEPLEGQLAVAEVIINRSRSGRFPASLCGVVHQRGQFSFVRGGRIPAIDRGSRAWREALAVAQVAQGEAWDSRAQNALFFHARRVSPGWRKTRVATLGNHVFYR